MRSLDEGDDCRMWYLRRHCSHAKRSDNKSNRAWLTSLHTTSIYFDPNNARASAISWASWPETNAGTSVNKPRRIPKLEQNQHASSMATYLPRRELSLSVAPGDRLALEYLLDQAMLKQYIGNPVPAVVGGETWEAAAFRFTQRPATEQDACALRGPAPVVGDKPPPEPPK
jgi:hypothetical protein